MAGRRTAQLFVGIALGSGIVIPIILLLITAPAATESKGGRAVRVSRCHDRLLQDWRDGRIERTYPLACYRTALEKLPTDLLLYSSAPEDIRQALSERIARSAAHARPLRKP